MNLSLPTNQRLAKPWRTIFTAITLTAIFLTSTSAPATACPFCSAVSQTLRQEMEVMDAVVIASCTHSDVLRNHSTGETTMRIEKVLMGGEHVKVGDEVKAVYYGEVAVGRRFMLSGVDPPDLQWSCLPVTERGEAYVTKVAELADRDPTERLHFYKDYLQDEETMLARDAYDEFAITPYPVLKKLAPEMDHDQLVKWLSEPELSTDRKRLFLTMLGVCGSKDDLPMLDKMLRSNKKSTRGGLDALIACYLTLAGEEGLPLIDELFLNNKTAPYADTYAAIMAVRFHGTEGDVIERSALVESLHHVLDRKDLADLVIPDLARWQDWTQIDRLTDLFLKSDPDNNWIRVPVVNYLRACPLDKAKEAIAKLEEFDPDSVKRANTFFSIPVPARDAKPATSDASSISVPVDSIVMGLSSDARLGLSSSLSLGLSKKQTSTSTSTHPTLRTASTSIPPITMAPGVKLASTASSVSPQIGLMTGPNVTSGAQPHRLANLLHLGLVIAIAISTLMIAQFLLLTGGTLPQTDSVPAMNETS